MMIGHQFMIDGRVERIMNYQIKENSISVDTDKKPRSFSEDQFMDWAKKCLPVQDDIEVLEEDLKPSRELKKFKEKEIMGSQVVYQPSFSSSNFSDLRSVLMENIKKVQEDKEYLPQAVAVRDNVQSIIELTKNEIEYVKTLNKMTR